MGMSADKRTPGLVSAIRSGSVHPGILVLRDGDCFRSRLVVLRGKLRRTEFEGELVDLAGEGEGHLIVVVVHPGAGIHANVEGLVSYFQESDRVCLLSCRNYLAVYFQFTTAALSDAGAVIGVLENDRVLARGEWLLADPSIMRECEHVVVEHRLAFEQVQPIPTKPPSIGDDHPVAATCWHIDLRGNRV